MTLQLTSRAWLAVRRGIARTATFWICGSVAWCALLALQLNAERPEPAQWLARALYFIQLACRYSALALLPLGALRLLRWFAVGRVRYADTLVTALLALPIAPLCWQQAEQLSSGGLLQDSALAAPLRGAMFMALLCGNLLLWHVHLALCRAPHHALDVRLSARFMSLRRRRPQLRWAVIWFTLGAALLYAFSETVDRGLRAYVFFSQFLMPSAWLFAASLLYGLQRRWLRLARWPIYALGVVLLTGLGASALAADEVRRVKAGFERRGGLIALTDLASSAQRGAPYANLDVSQPSRFKCPAPPKAAAKYVPPAPDHRNVILISIDTLRKDALNMRGQDGRPIAPNLRAIAERGLSFERAVTTYPATLFALGSALTGQSPSEVMFAPQPPDNLFRQTRSLFHEIIIALPSAGWFKRRPVPQLLTQGAIPSHFSDAEQATHYMITRLREARQKRHRSFSWIHYFEPHASEVVGRGERARRINRESYAGLVHQVDSQIGKLWSELDKLGYLRDSLVVVFSDHGEAMGEFDYFGHHVYLNQFATDVPLIVHAPGLRPARSEALALLSDIAPTVLEFLGFPAPPGDARNLLSLAADGGERYGMSEAFPVRGRALYDLARVPITSGPALEERIRLLRTAAIDYQPKVALVSARYRLIVNRVTGAEEFYDRALDPSEKRDLSQNHLPAHARMREALGRMERELSERIHCRVVGAPPSL